MGTDNEQNNATSEEKNVGLQALGDTTKTRRKFNRTAAGTAVFLTLGSRVSWASGGVQSKSETKCISKGVFDSTNPAASHDPNGKHAEMVEDFNKWAAGDFPKDAIDDQTQVIGPVVDEGSDYCVTLSWTEPD